MDNNQEKKGLLSEKKIEIIVAIFLAITALLTAWAGWISSLHGGNQATNYTTSNNLASDGNSRYVEATQNLNQDMNLWNNISNFVLDISYAQENGDQDAVDLNCYKLYYQANDSLSEELAQKIGWDMDKAEKASKDPTEFVLAWMETEGANVSPFDEEFIDSYYTDAEDKVAESEKYLEEGKTDNVRGDSYNFVTVFYSLVLFLFGISATFKNLPCRAGVVCGAVILFLLTTIYMLTIPMPTGFSFSSFFGN